MISQIMFMTLLTVFYQSDSNSIVDMLIWPKFFNSSISMWEVMVISVLKRFDQICTMYGLEFYNSVQKGPERLQANSYYWGGLGVPSKIENFKSNFFLVHGALIRLKWRGNVFF